MVALENGVRELPVTIRENWSVFNSSNGEFRNALISVCRKFSIEKETVWLVLDLIGIFSLIWIFLYLIL